jgi:hypothetical protein
MSHVFDLEPEFLELYELCREQTMTSLERMYALYSATRYIVANGIAGDLVECGVWRGGSVMLMAHTLMRVGDTTRTIWLYDTFTGMTPPQPDDVQTMSGRPAREVLAEDRSGLFHGVAPRAVVEQNLARTGYPNFRLIEGDVLTTLTSAPQTIALVRLDTDWYASTRHELEQLYPRVTPGGVLIIDDYGYWSGARKATDEYLASRGEHPLLHRLDYTGRLIVKQVGVGSGKST